MARPARFWHSLQLSNPWRLSLSTEADSGEDEIYDDFETSPHLVTPSPGWRKLPDLETPQAFFGKFVGKDGKLKVPEPSVSFKAPELPREGTETDPTPEFSELAVDWHRRLSQAFNSIAEYHKGKKCEVIVAGGGTGFKVDAGKMGFESWERVALPDCGYSISFFLISFLTFAFGCLLTLFLLTFTLRVAWQPNAQFSPSRTVAKGSSATPSLLPSKCLVKR